MFMRRARMISPRALLLALLVAAFGLVTVQPIKAQSCASGTPPQHFNCPIRQSASGV